MKLKNLFALWCIALCFACSDPKLESRAYPSIDTDNATDITADGAVLHGEILSLGTGGVKDYGFVYADRPALLGNGNVISLGKSPKTGKFSAIADRDLPKTLGSQKLCYFSTYAITDAGLVVYGQQRSFTGLGGKPPVINELKPSVGFVSDSVLIIGSGFSNYTLNNAVYFENAPARILKSNGDTIICIVPFAHSGTEKVKVVVSGETSPSKDFQVLESTFTSFTPEFVTFGDTVFLNGSNFPSARPSIEVIVLGRGPAVLASSTSTQLKVIVPNEVTQTQSPVTFTFGFASTTSSELIKLLPPVIDSFSPESGFVDTEVTITGKNFNPVAARNIVTIAGVNATIVSAANKKLVIKVPAVSAGDHSIDVTILGQKGTSSGTFKVQ